MTNKPMLSVERLLMDIRQSCELSKARDAQIDAALVELRAILDKEVGEDSHTPKQQGEPVANEELEAYKVAFDEGHKAAMYHSGTSLMAYMEVMRNLQLDVIKERKEKGA